MDTRVLVTAWMRVATTLILIVSMLVSQGCSFLSPPTQDVTIRTDDSRAQIFVNNRPVGVGEARVSLRKNEYHAIYAESDGRRSTVARLNRDISTTGVLDIIGGVFFLVPAAGLLAPGFWRLNPGDVYLRTAPPPDTRPVAFSASPDGR